MLDCGILDGGMLDGGSGGVQASVTNLPHLARIETRSVEPDAAPRTTNSYLITRI
jgi:hypothetical protein